MNQSVEASKPKLGPTQAILQKPMSATLGHGLVELGKTTLEKLSHIFCGNVIGCEQETVIDNPIIFCCLIQDYELSKCTKRPNWLVCQPQARHFN